MNKLCNCKRSYKPKLIRHWRRMLIRQDQMKEPLKSRQPQMLRTSSCFRHPMGLLPLDLVLLLTDFWRNSSPKTAKKVTSCLLSRRYLAKCTEVDLWFCIWGITAMLAPIAPKAPLSSVQAQRMFSGKSTLAFLPRPKRLTWARFLSHLPRLFRSQVNLMALIEMRRFSNQFSTLKSL